MSKITEAELAVCGAIVEGHWAEVVAAGITDAEQFYHPAAREFYRVAKEHNGDVPAIYTAFDGRQLDGGDAVEVLTKMGDNAPVPAEIPGWAREVLAAWRRRGAAKAHAAIAKALEAGKPEVAARWQEELAKFEEQLDARPQAKPFAAMPLATFLERQYPPKEAIVEGVLNCGEFMLIAADPKLGKTLFGVQMAIAVARGEPFMDWRTSCGAAIYLNMELSGAQMQERVRQQNGGTSDGVPLVFINALDEDERPNIQTLKERLKATVAALGLDEQVKLIVADPFYALALGISENDTQEVVPILHTFKEIAVELGVGLVLFHHTGKGATGEKATTERFRGSSAFRDVPDAFCSLVKESEDETERRVIFSGHWRGPGIPPQSLRLDLGTLRWECLGRAESAMPKRGRKATYTVERLLACFHNPAEWLRWSDFVARGIGRDAVTPLCEEAISQGALVKEGDSYHPPYREIEI